MDDQPGEPEMKRISILGVTFLVSTSLASITGAQAATECQAEIVKGRTSHWTYRLIDGRKCWYEGKTQLPKSELYWADQKAPAAQAAPAPAVNPPSTNAQASPAPAAEEEAFTDPEDGSCCWPPETRDSFELRWRSLGVKPRN
jgi:hypothetical protein